MYFYFGPTFLCKVLFFHNVVYFLKNLANRIATKVAPRFGICRFQKRVTSELGKMVTRLISNAEDPKIVDKTKIDNKKYHLMEDIQ